MRTLLCRCVHSIASLIVCVCVLAFVPGSAPAQHDGEMFCAHDEATNQSFALDPGMRLRWQAADEHIARTIETLLRRGGAPAIASGGRGEYVIPVVVHIVHDGGEEDIPDARVVEGIRQLNEAFANMAAFSSPNGVATGIRFCLARQDPAGRATSGITRTRSPLTVSFHERDSRALKALSRWDPLRYLNVWVIRDLTSNTNSSGSLLAGFAFGPGSHGDDNDGVVIEAHLVGGSTGEAKTFVHEVGHYLGLYHTFQQGCVNDNCSTQGDRVCDTPPDASSKPAPCGVALNSCTTDEDDTKPRNPFRANALGGLGDQPDPADNYMDYGTPACMVRFTPGQAERMVAAIVGPRASLLASPACDDPCRLSIVAGCDPPAQPYAGRPLRFTNTTAGASRYEWLIDGAIVATSVDLQTTFANRGAYTVTLRAYNGDTTCMREHTMRLVVRCPMSLSFTADRTQILPGERVALRSTSAPGLALTWLVDGQPVGAGGLYDLMLSAAGAYRVQLVGNDGVCSDTTEATVVQVGDCRVVRDNMRWQFGFAAGLDFRTGAPTLEPGAASAREGVTSISDQDGHLLMYSNGVDIWNAQHRLMTGGTGIGGSQWAAQSCLIIKAPLSDSLYYVFTNGDWGDRGGRLGYSVVDMSLDGGLGAVTLKNVPLNKAAAEWMAAAYHANCIDIWLLSHERDNDVFVAYRLTPTGVDTVAVRSAVGRRIMGANRYGTMRFSPDGSMLAMAHGGSTSDYVLTLFQFDASAGTLSRPLYLAHGRSYEGAYGVEFSPNNKLLYTTAINGKSVRQFNLSVLNQNVITASLVAIGANNDMRQALALGPDGRIYVGKSDLGSLDVIEYPNVPGTACTYRINGLGLGGHNAGMGLPNWVRGYQIRTPGISTPQAVCSNERAVCTGYGGWCSRGTYQWSVSGPATIAWTRGAEVALDFNGPGTVQLMLDNRGLCSSFYDTASFTVHATPQTDLGPDTIVCGGAGILLDAGAGHTGYEWNTGFTGRMLNATATGTYWVRVTNADGCSASDTVDVTVSSAVAVLDLGADREICVGEVVSLDAGAEFAVYRWQDGSSDQQYTATAPGRFWVEAVTLCGDTLRDSVTIKERANDVLDLGPDLVLCRGDRRSLDAGPVGAYYVWSTGERTQAIDVTDTGVYWVRAGNGRCEWSDTVQVTLDAEPGFVASLPDVAPVAVGATIDVPIVVRQARGCRSTEVRAFTAAIRYRRSMLMPLATPPPVADGADAVVTITGSTGASDTAITLRFRTLLGDTLTTPLVFDTFELGGVLGRNLELRNGSASLEVCEAGGSPRLISVGAPAGLRVAVRDGRITVHYTLLEDAPAAIRVTDLFGRTVATMLDGNHKPGDGVVAISFGDLPSATYFVALSTPAGVIAKKILILR